MGEGTRDEYDKQCCITIFVLLIIGILVTAIGTTSCQVTKFVLLIHIFQSGETCTCDEHSCEGNGCSDSSCFLYSLSICLPVIAFCTWAKERGKKPKTTK